MTFLLPPGVEGLTVFSLSFWQDSECTYKEVMFSQSKEEFWKDTTKRKEIVNANILLSLSPKNQILVLPIFYI